jgi:ribosomal protein L11 methyltransferase
MQLLTVTVGPEDVERAYDVLLRLSPDGVHQRDHEDRVELFVYGPEVPDPAALGALAPLLVTEPTVRSASDDWRERRRERYRPRVYGGRLAVRPAWADPPAAGLVDVVLGEGTAAFGTGDHPTTRACLELLCQLPVGDSLADLGCGSGVLAVAAAALGWRRVHAVDVDPRSVRATEVNARRNGVAVDVAALDLTRDDPPRATVSVANVPPFVHEHLAGRLTSSTVVATGIEAARTEEVVRAYDRAGYPPVVVEQLFGWTLLVAVRAGR